MLFIYREVVYWNVGFADSEAVPQCAIAAGHHDRLDTCLNRGLHEVVSAEHIRFEGCIERDASLFSICAHIRMIDGTRLGTEVLDSVYTFNSTLAVLKVVQVALNKWEVREFSRWRSARHEDE